MTVVRPVAPPATPLIADTTAEYCRRARHLRWRHRGDSSRLMHELRDLAHQGPRPSPRIVPQRSGTAIFTSLVEDALHACDGSLRYSRRLELLREGEQLGLGRFEANLIIAVCQNRVRNAAPQPALTNRWLPTLACTALVQISIAWAAWRIFL